jgi:hypothetical protein
LLAHIADEQVKCHVFGSASLRTPTIATAPFIVCRGSRKYETLHDESKTWWSDCLRDAVNFIV